MRESAFQWDILRALSSGSQRRISRSKARVATRLEISGDRSLVACDAAGGVGDFLWSKSSDFFLTSLSQLLSRHRRQMMLLVVRDLTVPHHEDDLQTLGAQRPQGRMMIVAPRPLLIVVGPGPLTLAQREKRHLIDDVAQRLVTGEAEPNDPLLAA